MDDQYTPIDRTALYEEVWTDPVAIVAPRYGISDVALAKACKKLKIPLPGRGYWAKVKAGRKPPRVLLPTIDKAKLPHVFLRRIDIEHMEAQTQASRREREARDAVGPIEVPTELSKPHALTRAASKRLKQRDGWTNEKGLRSAPGEVLNIEVTRSSLDRALLLFDVLIKELAKRSITVHVDTAAQRTILDVEGTPVSLAITEKIKRTRHEPTPAELKAQERYWDRTFSGLLSNDTTYPHIPNYDYHPTGVLTITANHYWPSRSWNDTPRSPLEKRLGNVIAGITTLAVEIRAEEAEAARKEAERQRAQDRYAARKKRWETEQAKFKQLEEHASAWERAQR